MVIEGMHCAACVWLLEKLPEILPGVIESAVTALVAAGATYALDGDLYLDLAQRPDFGSVSGWSREHMLEVFADRGGDPDRPGKRDPLDPLLWLAARPGEPSWPSDRLGSGRPGWHIECTAIAAELLGIPFAIQGGGQDLIFPHHEMSAVQGTAMCGCATFAQAYVHQAMVGLDGAKMSKSKGNLVLVSRLRADGHDPMAIRLVLLAQHYREPWDWQAELLDQATARLQRWRQAAAAAASAGRATADAESVLQQLRQRLRNDLDTPGALAVIDRWADDASDGMVAQAVDALLGVRL